MLTLLTVEAAAASHLAGALLIEPNAGSGRAVCVVRSCAAPFAAVSYLTADLNQSGRLGLVPATASPLGLLVLPALLWGSDPELLADLPRESPVDLTVPRHGAASVARTGPASVVASLVDLLATLIAQMALEVATFHRTTVSSTDSASAASEAGSGLSRS